MNNQDKVAELKRIISTAQDDLALLLKKGKRFKPETEIKYHLVNGDGTTSKTYNNDLRVDRYYYNNFNVDNLGPCVSTEKKWEEAAALLKEWGIE